MMLIPLSSPIGPFPSEWHTRLKPPANHSQVSVARYLPPGPNGLGFSSASEVHLPTKYASFLCSGPGCGGPAGACAKIGRASCRERVEVSVVAGRWREK